MQCDIRIKSPTYPITTDLVIAHDADASILSLKTKIRDGLGNDALVASSQKLIYAGHVLEDDKTLLQLNIPSSATFHLVTPPHVSPRPVAELEEASPPSQQATIESNSAPEPMIAAPHADEPAPAAPVDTGSSPSSSSGESAGPSASQAEPSVSAATSNSPMASFAADTHAFIRQHERVEQSGVSYDLCYIDGFPYLVKAAERSSRSSRRARRQNTSMGHSTAAASNLNGRAQLPMTTHNASIRQHHVDLPATAAIPVRTAEGQRALILSPEGVRAMAAQGVNVETNTSSRAGPFGINSVALRRFMTQGVPHAWLILKLAFLVTMLGSNATWTRFLILNLIAAGIFFWQSGMLGRLLGQPDTPPARANRQDAEPPRDRANSGVVPPANTTPAEATDGQAMGSNSMGAAPAPAPAPTLLQSFTNAFLASILPRNSRAAAQGPGNQNIARAELPAQGTANGAAQESSANSTTTTTSAAAVVDEPSAAPEDTNDANGQHDAREQAVVEQELQRDW